MIPIRDENPSGTFPFVTLLFILANVAVFVLEMASQALPEADLVARYALVPARAWWSAERGFVDNLQALLPFGTAMFLHGGAAHIIGNMWFLWLFGDNVEDRLGHAAFFVFYLVCGLAASVAHVLYVGTASTVPMIGASGAISGVLGAYVVCFPRARVLTIIPIFIFIQLVRLPAFVFLFVWLGMQVLGMLATADTPDAPGTAWLAHLGGFGAGVLLVFFWPKNKRSHQSTYLATPDVWRARRHA